MKLKKKIAVKTYWVLAKYKVKVEHTPMLAILQAIAEVDTISPFELYETLLSPLSEQACGNLLIRLEQMGYVEEKVENSYSRMGGWEPYNTGEYELSTLGKSAVNDKVFYEERKGTLKIIITEINDFISQKVVKIQELGKDTKDYENQNATTQNLPNDILGLAKTQEIITLNTGVYIIDEIEKKGIVDNIQEVELEVNIEDSGSTAKVLDYENRDDRWAKRNAESEILTNQYHQNYIQNQNIVKVFFDNNNIALSRKETIGNPLIGKTSFDAIRMELQLSPMNSKDAKLWYLAYLKEQISTRPYFLSDKEFTEHANELAKSFVLFENELKYEFSRMSVLKEFDKKEDFYIRAKLETIDYLNY